METVIYAAGEGVWNIRGRPWAEMWEVEAQGLEGEFLQGIGVDCGDPLIVYAAVRDVVWVSRDGGSSWAKPPNEGLASVEIWTLAAHPQEPGCLMVGASPAALFVSEDWAESWAERRALREVPGAASWTFPVPPHLAHVRAIALETEPKEAIYVGIEVGGVYRSEDGGSTWEERSEGVYPDIHSLTPDTTSPGTLYAMTGAGPYATSDGGRRWRFLGRPLRRNYTVPCALHPDAPQRLFIAAAAGPPPTWARGGADAAIYRSDDGGETWEEVWEAIPGGIDGMVYRLAIDGRDPDQIYAATTDGGILLSVDGGDHWQVLPVRCPGLRDLAVIPGGEL